MARSETLSKFQEKRVDDIAIAMFDYHVTSDELISQLEEAARILDCTVAQLTATYVRSSLSVFAQTPRHINHNLGVLDFDLDYARKSLGTMLAESRAVKQR